MSADAVRWAKSVIAGGAGQKCILIVLADYADEEHSCFPGQKLLARITEQGERTVRRHLVDMEAAGLLRRESRMRADGRGRTSDRFYLAVDQPANVSGNSDDRPTTTSEDQPANHDDQPANDARPTGHSLAGQELLGNRQKEPPDSSPTFDAFWAVYRRHEEKPDARRAWNLAIKKATPEVIIAGAVRYMADPNREAKFTPYPAKWLKNERWDDDPQPPLVRKPGQAPPETPNEHLPANLRTYETPEEFAAWQASQK